MVILFCGDREWKNTAVIHTVLTELLQRYNSFTMIHGAARGADSIAAYIGKYHFNLDVQGYKANWNTHGKAAGPIRNRQMLDEGKPDLVVAFHNDLARSKGTKDMVKIAKLANIPVLWYTEEGLQDDKDYS